MLNVIVQGITGQEGFRHTQRMLECGTNIVGGVNPKKAGEILKFSKNGKNKDIEVFANCLDAVNKTNANATVIFVPPAFAKNAVIEAIDANIELIVIITEGIPQLDSIYFVDYAKAKSIENNIKIQIIGPNCPGLVTFNNHDFKISENLGIIPDGLVKKFGKLGLVSRSGTLTYQLMDIFGEIGFKKCYGIGGDVNPGTTFIEPLADFLNDDDIEAIILVGEIGGNLEEQAAEFLKKSRQIKPIFVYIAGFSAPIGKTMGHAGAIITKNSGTVESKQRAFEEVGVKCYKSIQDLSDCVQKYFSEDKNL